MSEYKLIQAQRDIILSDSDKILVSASAGTGKTFVMVERIIDILINKGGDIDDLLVVTFTKASAEEMRGRIREALKNNIKRAPSIKKQLKKLSTASISTLHSFCSDMIKRYFYAADMPPKFNVLDDVKSNVIKHEIMEDLISDLYDDKKENFLRLSEIFAPKRRDDALSDAVISVFNFAQSLEDPEAFIISAKTLKASEKYYAFAANGSESYLEESLEELCAIYQRLKNDGLSRFTEIASQYIKAINHALKAKHFEKRISILFNRLSLGEPLSKLTPKKAEKTESFESFSAFRKEFVDKIREYNAIVEMSTDDESLRRIESDISTFCDIVLEFSRRYRLEKDKSAYLDFADLEHYALKLLRKPEVIGDIREKYKYVFVDEYQDTSKVQEALLQAISKGNNLFVVGDIKQSIYGFRQCDMSIFAEKEASYGKTTEGEVHYLNTNFRSGGTILKFVNELFSTLMTKDVGVDYAATSQFESLRPDFGEVELDIINFKKEKEFAEPIVYSVSEDDNVDSELKSGEIEGKFIAKKIKELVGTTFFDGKTERPITYDDICILSRDISSVKSTNLYKAILGEGIPIISSSSGAKLFDIPEVVQAASFINVLQNYKNDVPLLSVLKSPFFSFTDEELATIRQNDRKAKFFHEALLTAKTEGTLTAKVNDFFDAVQKYRYTALARGGVYALKKAIYETPFECVTLSKFNGKKKLSLVNDFISKISAICEDGNLAGLNNAIDILKEDIKASDVITSDGAVTFMTIHKSKGLEFPIVFLSNLAKGRPNISDTVICDKDLGIAIKDYDLATRQKKNSLPYLAIQAKKKKEDRDENLRVLYVALTRAKSKLILTGVKTYADDPPQSLEEAYPNEANANADNLEIICRALMAKNSHANIRFIDGERERLLPIRFLPSASTDLELSKQAIENVLDYSYEHEIDTRLPTKFTASNLKRDFFVEEEVSYKLPDIYRDDKIAIGTAYHKLLDGAKPLATYDTVKQVLEKEVASGNIDESLKSKLDIESVVKALNLPIMSFGRAYTEKPFMMKVPAKLFTEYDTDKEVLVQGVIDLLLVDGDEAVVVDYKYTSETNPSILRSRYSEQLKCYAYAVEHGAGLKVKKSYLLNLRNFKLIEI